MKLIIKQSEKAHHRNQLHDQLLAAGLEAESLTVTGDGKQTVLEYPDAQDGAVRAVVDEHEPAAPKVKPDRGALLEDFKRKRAGAAARQGASLSEWRTSVNDALAAADVLLEALVSG